MADATTMPSAIPAADQAAIDKALKGVNGTEEPTADQFDFFGGSDDREKWYFPGQTEQWIEFMVMNEGQRKRYQRKTNRDVKVSRKDQSAAISMDPGADREALLLEVVTDWYVIDRKSGQPVPFNKGAQGGDNTKSGSPGSIFGQWMNRANPVLIDKLELAIRNANKWMQDEMDPVSIREEIDRLEELYTEAVAREEAKS